MNKKESIEYENLFMEIWGKFEIYSNSDLSLDQLRQIHSIIFPQEADNAL